MIAGKTKAALAATAILALAACGNAPREDASPFSVLRQAAGQMLPGGGAAAEGAAQAAPDTPDAMAARAREANPGPLLLAVLESTEAAQVLALTGENGGMRTYMTANQQALIMRGGVLSGTRGMLGHDLSTAEADGAAALIRARRPGQANRVMRYLSGDGVERPLPLQCDVVVGGQQDYGFAGNSWRGTQVAETCRGAGGLSVQNSYLVTADGQIPLSRQWIGPQLGHVILQTIRP
ncbi:MAG: YjbF family lipoprotein [Paracoccus sp. (in: a-proteobacteria)]|nr:YjbF family lipoprotein [Paracoccus sp. (in: a-proteobacteria)]